MFRGGNIPSFWGWGDAILVVVWGCILFATAWGCNDSDSFVWLLLGFSLQHTALI